MSAFRVKLICVIPFIIATAIITCSIYIFKIIYHSAWITFNHFCDEWERNGKEIPDVEHSNG